MCHCNEMVSAHMRGIYFVHMVFRTISIEHWPYSDRYFIQTEICISAPVLGWHIYTAGWFFHFNAPVTWLIGALALRCEVRRREMLTMLMQSCLYSMWLWSYPFQIQRLWWKKSVDCNRTDNHLLLVFSFFENAYPFSWMSCNMTNSKLFWCTGQLTTHTMTSFILLEGVEESKIDNYCILWMFLN